MIGARGDKDKETSTSFKSQYELHGRQITEEKTTFIRHIPFLSLQNASGWPRRHVWPPCAIYDACCMGASPRTRRGRSLSFTRACESFLDKQQGFWTLALCLLVSNLTRERFCRSKRAVTGRFKDAIRSDFEERKDLSGNGKELLWAVIFRLQTSNW